MTTVYSDLSIKVYIGFQSLVHYNKQLRDEPGSLFKLLIMSCLWMQIVACKISNSFVARARSASQLTRHKDIGVAQMLLIWN